MSRPKSFPETIYVGMGKQNKLVLLSKQVAEALEGIDVRTAKYTMSVLSEPSKPLLRKRRSKTTKTPISTPPQQDNPPQKQPEASTPKPEDSQEEAASWYCKACGKDVENPRTVNGKPQCPHCLRLGTIKGKE
jgi:hypothetical protein